MKYCPKCKKLYNDSDLVCTGEECKSRVLKTVEDEQTSVYLCSGDVIERDRVQAALSDCGIYEKAYDTAVGIGAIKLEGEEIIDEAADGEPEEEMSDRKRNVVRIITAILFILIVALVIYGTDFITGFIKSLFT